jgi:hypothetical protein
MKYSQKNINFHILSTKYLSVAKRFLEMSNYHESLCNFIFSECRFQPFNSPKGNTGVGGKNWGNEIALLNLQKNTPYLSYKSLNISYVH